MQSFYELTTAFEQYFAQHQFPKEPASLYEPCSYLLQMGGKRVRPVLCLMSHEMFAPINENVWNTATAIELFHNFTLMHDDIMDNAPLRRGNQTVHEKYSLSTAILSGDVMNIFAYEHLNKVNTQYIHDVLAFFNKTAIEICEGQQYDMDFEKRVEVSMDEYMHMITLKTSVLLGASLKLGAMLGGATDGCSGLLYDFGIHLGLAFQLKDDYLDTFGTTAATGKQIGGDILSNKKTYLLSKAFEVANDVQKEKLNALLVRNDAQKVNDMIALYEELGVKESLQQEIVHYSNNALELLEKVPVVGKRKVHLQELANILLNRDK